MSDLVVVVDLICFVCHKNGILPTTLDFMSGRFQEIRNELEGGYTDLICSPNCLNPDELAMFDKHVAFNELWNVLVVTMVKV